MQNMSPARLVYQQFLEEGTDWELIRFFSDYFLLPMVSLFIFCTTHFDKFSVILFLQKLARSLNAGND